ncbi:xanthine dehydrogenase family protein molybdopterin-binding subunit [Brevibacterium sp. BDJS002]|uniref:xanthine dehydrogenase family protein molybdopterin-binding subunit n=1 Tax=Brevibacterium sp. BDJS002 TaxID=3020906 RepID=UPI00230772A0|nr:xanthine dehydrogenase family protein molybdopterin-binding subunit [Brevibacterium sp. BDJS002]WCE41203.1 xanthine dehydrogenase family protein molybdopterin-binding subunit [Brevibacterium sp. BDJS002]
MHNDVTHHPPDESAKTHSSTTNTYAGSGLTGKNNPILAAGRATFLDDIDLPGCMTMSVLRSPHASATIDHIDTTDALTIPGVELLITGRDTVEHSLKIGPAGAFDFLSVKQSDRYPLAVDSVRYVGEPVAAVVATSPQTAARAVAAIDVHYTLRTPVVTVEQALAPDAPLVESDWANNLMIDWEFGKGSLVNGCAGTFETTAIAALTASGRLDCGRIIPTSIEPRGIIAQWDRWTDSLTVWASTQGPHVLKTQLGGVLGLDDSKLRVIMPSVGGAFGGKIPIFPEDILTAWAAIQLACPVKFVEERHEALPAAGHSRDIACDYKVAFSSDGVIDSLDIELAANLGAPQTFAGYLMAIVTAGCIPGSYDIPNSHVHLRGAVTNLGPWQAYRGYGKEAATYFLERILDEVADITGVDRAEVRKRNFVTSDQFPYQLPSGWIMDSGDYHGTLDQVLELIDAESFETRRATAAAEGRVLGLGFAHELTPEGSSRPGSLLGGTDSTTVRISPRGYITVLTGVTSPGGGNETGLAQIVADVLGADIDHITVVQGDTLSCPHGNGNYSSRSLTIGGASARLAAEDCRRKIDTVAARKLGVAEGTLTFSRGVIHSSATDASTTIGEIAGEIYRHPHGVLMDGIEPNLESTRSFKMPNVHHQPERTGLYNQYPTWSFGALACIVEVDPATGEVTVVEFALSHDCGVVVNPTLAEAQLHGAVMQGVGAALYEEFTYDERGNPECPSLREYTLPSAREWFPITMGHRSTPSPFTHGGMKGVGESGISAPSPAIASAIEDALAGYDSRLKVKLKTVPFTPERVWNAIEEVRA